MVRRNESYCRWSLLCHRSWPWPWPCPSPSPARPPLKLAARKGASTLPFLFPPRPTRSKGRSYTRPLRWSSALWLIRVSGLFFTALALALLSPAVTPFHPAEAVRSSRFSGYFPFRSRQIPLAAASTVDASASSPLAFFRRAPTFRDADDCGTSGSFLGDRRNRAFSGVCDASLVHVAMTLDSEYIRGTVAAVHSILHHAQCPEKVFFHFLASEKGLAVLVRSVFPKLRFEVYHFDTERVRNLISPSVRRALEHPLNYARNYLANVLESCVRRVIYLDSDVVIVDDISELWRTNLGNLTVGAPEYCHANFTRYFTERFWADSRLANVFIGRPRVPCYFNTGVMVMDLWRWRRRGCTRRIERWMEVQRDESKIYELGSLPPLLLEFAGRVAPVGHRWNQHGLGGDNVKGSCRELHPGPSSLLHWSGSGKPWARLDAGKACPVDALWAFYDLYDPLPWTS